MVGQVPPVTITQRPPTKNGATAPARPTAAPQPAPRAQVPAPGARKELPKWRRGFAAAVPWLLAAFLSGLVIQVALAGYGLLEVGGQGMEAHLTFAHVIEAIPLLILLAGFLGGDKVAGIVGIALLVLFQLQYLFIAVGEPFARAMHPTNALVLFGLTLGLLLKRPMWTGKAF